MSKISVLLDQAGKLRYLMRRRQCLDKLKSIQIKLRQAIIEGDYKKADMWLNLLEQAQTEFEELI